jgi:hypothetical protein
MGHQTLADRQPETGAASMLPALSQLPEWLEDSAHVAGGDADAGVLHLDQQPLVGEAGAQRDLSVIRELDGIV